LKLLENPSDMMMRWKPRCTGVCKHWALISSQQESNTWCITETNVLICVAIIWTNTGSVHYSLSFWMSMSK
jgi:hypothetical protein